MIKHAVTITNPLGIHVRIAAEIVHHADVLKRKYNTSLYVRKSTDSAPIAISMIALLSLRIEKDDIVEVSCKEDSVEGRNAVIELSNYISRLVTDKNENMYKLDNIMVQSNIANEQILQSISVGIVVVDINSSIVSMNNYGLKFLNMTLEEVIGKNVSDIIPTSDLSTVINSRKKHIGTTQIINNKEVLVTRSPIFSENKVIGAVGVFQDISELVAVKELNEKFSKILECSSDLICFVDENRKISYLNPSYMKYLPLSSQDALGKDLKDISADGLRMKVFNTREKVENYVYQKENIDLICTIEPLFIDRTFKGIISILKPVDQIKNLLLKLEHSQEELNYYKKELLRHSKLSNSFADIIGSNSSLQDSILMAEKASKSISTVLIRGESGTGKELVAKAIHNNSNRKDKPFIRVNCAAIPENLLESELFGYEKGAFTGAVKNKPGKFALADGGTIFLDEIGDMPISMQVKLLRVLQEKEFESVGGIVTQKVDTRVIAATNRPLEEMLKSGEFREDLYYRLNVITIMLPPLKSRKEDICELTEYFIKKINKKLDKNIKGISKEALNYLHDYNWPGNIRELENIIERAINMCESSVITEKDLPIYLTNIIPQKEYTLSFSDGDLLTMKEYEKEIISAAMKKYKSYNKAGKVLGLTHRTISLKCEKYGIPHEN
ncbi:sigma 54-interacting transcriptional regulator [Clostridium oryzae]|uniref:HTH-type transcriptional regulatory protein TyrR n=1 Tax=Clostridium oryzae TaxID=1450648 RepID=A0A1V4IDG2_9CLOT|nr:sigma 54-interacting transcriptional regulator [Clostridium oryzae]OPJ57557.1 Nif-specific regulatory protein [Clostridium oryzae]